MPVTQPRPVREHREQQGGVGDGGGERAVLGHPEPGLVAEVGRHDARARLDADQPAARRGDPDRAHAVVAVRDRHGPGCDRRRGAAGRPARRAVGVPRVAGDAEDRVGGAEDAQLRDRGQPDDDRAGRAQPTHDLVVDGLRGRVGRLGADAHRLAGHRHVVLDRDRDAGQRQVGAIGTPVDLVGLAQGVEGAHDLEGVEVGDVLDPRQRVLDGPARGEAAGPHLGGDGGGGGRVAVGHEPLSTGCPPTGRARTVVGGRVHARWRSDELRYRGWPIAVSRVTLDTVRDASRHARRGRSIVGRPRTDPRSPQRPVRTWRGRMTAQDFRPCRARRRRAATRCSPTAIRWPRPARTSPAARCARRRRARDSSASSWSSTSSTWHVPATRPGWERITTLVASLPADAVGHRRSRSSPAGSSSSRPRPAPTSRPPSPPSPPTAAR